MEWFDPGSAQLALLVRDDGGRCSTLLLSDVIPALSRDLPPVCLKRCNGKDRAEPCQLSETRFIVTDPMETTPCGVRK